MFRSNNVEFNLYLRLLPVGCCLHCSVTMRCSWKLFSASPGEAPTVERFQRWVVPTRNPLMANEKEKLTIFPGRLAGSRTSCHRPVCNIHFHTINANVNTVIYSRNWILEVSDGACFARQMEQRFKWKAFRFFFSFGVRCIRAFGTLNTMWYGGKLPKRNKINQKAHKLCIFSSTSKSRSYRQPMLKLELWSSSR